MTEYQDGKQHQALENLSDAVRQFYRTMDNGYADAADLAQALVGLERAIQVAQQAGCANQDIVAIYDALAEEVA